MDAAPVPESGENGQRDEILLLARPLVAAYLRGRLPRRASSELEDLCQETLLAAWDALSRPDGGYIKRPIAYILGIARRKACALMQERARIGSLKVKEAEALSSSVTRSSPSPERILLEDEQRRLLERGMDRLDSREASYLRFRFLQDLPHSTACLETGLSPARGSRLKYRAVLKLRRHLEKLRAPRGPKRRLGRAPL